MSHQIFLTAFDHCNLLHAGYSSVLSVTRRHQMCFRANVCLALCLLTQLASLSSIVSQSPRSILQLQSHPWMKIDPFLQDQEGLRWKFPWTVCFPAPQQGGSTFWHPSLITNTQGASSLYCCRHSLRLEYWKGEQGYTDQLLHANGFMNHKPRISSQRHQLILSNQSTASSSFSPLFYHPRTPVVSTE